MITAEIICDSISPERKRLTTFKLRYPKFIHGEFMTHRLISRNASSSRAIPVERMIEEVRSDALRAAPVFWGKNQKGMQAAEEFSDEKEFGVPPNLYSEKDFAKAKWEEAALAAASIAGVLNTFGLHKQITNRILEPFLHINVVATATEWDNFFGLRLHAAAQPEMRALAVVMWDARKASVPKELRMDDWHLPYVRGYMDDRELLSPGNRQGLTPHAQMIRVSVARCARVSYESFETGKRSTVEEDIKLYDRLTAGLADPTQPLHASPMEHQATSDQITAVRGFEEWVNPELHGNFVGWRQYRKMLPNEAVAPLPVEYQR